MIREVESRKTHKKRPPTNAEKKERPEITAVYEPDFGKKKGEDRIADSE